MRKGYFLLLACLLAIPTFGVPSHDNYIVQDDVLGSWMHSYYGTWTPGAPPTGGSENENFFIGRVRPLKRFTNEATQVIQDEATQITRRANRGLLWWVPIGENDNGSWTSLPSYSFESEAFSMWSYITIYGNWTQGFLRQPGAFADACHKNGVQTACVSAAPWAVGLTSTDGGHGQNYQALINGGADKLLKLFRYYGIDGLGFNSEQDWGMRSGMKTLIQNCQDKKATYGLEDRLHFDFYQLSDVLGSGGSGTDFSDFFPDANGFFLNYNWGAGNLANSVSNAINKGGNSYDVYAGMDQQGRSVADWTSLNNYPISVGIWGAHNKNMIWQGSTSDGSAPLAIQNCYLRKCEQFFTGGTQNPVNDIAITNELCTGNAGFFGVSKLVAAKSALSWITNSYFPFISYLNLGVGKFFNNEGETTFDSEWYNIGMQDHLPTWRWWITDTYMGRSTSNVPSDTHATFTFDDAWFGGSCMKLTFDNAVSSGFRYIQLFKTQFPIADANYTLRVRYKALSGSANMQYTMSKEGAESTIITQAMGTM
ncbi:MAG: secretion protein Por, partial [Paludibacteraceae bacterium]|nr:secretion protein Por [Paludibacteraceae bacterium]